MSHIKTAVSILLIALAITGCKKDEANPVNTTPQPTSSTYVGTVGTATESGKLTLNVTLGKSTGTSGSVSGTLVLVHPSAATITLAGTFSSNTLAVSGGGYTFTGTLANGVLSGTYTGPNGNGAFSSQSGTTVQVYVGTYTSQTGGGNGTFNLVVSGGALSGIAVKSSSGSRVALMGTVSGNALDIRSTAYPAVGLASGTINGAAVSGSYDDGQGDRGTWSGTLVQ